MCPSGSFNNHELRAHLVSSTSLIHSPFPLLFWSKTLLCKYFKYFIFYICKSHLFKHTKSQCHYRLKIIKSNSLFPSNIQSERTSACGCNRVACDRIAQFSKDYQQWMRYISDAWSHPEVWGQAWLKRPRPKGKEAHYSSCCHFSCSICQFFSSKSERLRNKVEGLCKEAEKQRQASHNTGRRKAGV